MRITIGVELECASLTDAAPAIIRERSFHRHFDRTITAADGSALPDPAELVTQPIPVTVGVSSQAPYSATISEWEVAMRPIKDLCLCAAMVNKTCGIHVHLGRPPTRGNRSAWSPEQIRTWLAIGIALEERLFTLVPSSRHNNRHCAKIGTLYPSTEIRSLSPMGRVSPRKYENSKRYCWLNLIETVRAGTDSTPYRASSEATGTVEIRLLGNVKRFDYVSAWIKLWVKIATHVAYTPALDAIINCTIGKGLEDDFAAVKRAKESIYITQSAAEKLRREREASPEVLAETVSEQADPVSLGDLSQPAADAISATGTTTGRMQSATPNVSPRTIAPQISQ